MFRGQPCGTSVRVDRAVRGDQQRGRTIHSLPVFLRLAGRPVILIGSGSTADAKRRLLDRAGASVVGEDDAQARLALVVDDEAAVARLKARGVLVNAVDGPDLCDFTLPAIVDRDPLIVAIGTGGASAGLAKAVRQRIETLLPAALGALADALAAAKPALRTRFPDPDTRRHALDRAFAAGGALDPGAAAHDVAGWLATVADAPVNRIETIRLTSPDPDELTLRAARLLGQADRVYHPPGLAPALLTRARADADRIAGDPPTPPLPGLSLHLVMA